MKLDGYVVVPPLNPWDKKELWLDFGYKTFAVNPAASWHRFTGLDLSNPETSMRIQRWHDKGYRVKRATMEIHDE